MVSLTGSSYPRDGAPDFFGLWSVRFSLVLVRTGRRLPVQALCERRVLVALTGYPRGGAPGPGRNFVTRATRNQRELGIWYMESGPSRVNAPLEGPVIPRSRRDLFKDQSCADSYNVGTKAFWSLEGALSSRSH